MPIIRSVKSADSRIINSHTRIPSRGVRSPIGPLFQLNGEVTDVVALCTDDDILIEVIFVYIFSLKPFGFWRRQFIESVYIFPEALWILETPIHRKPLFVYIFSLKPFGFWRRQFIESPCQQGDPLSLETLKPLDLLVPLKH